MTTYKLFVESGPMHRKTMVHVLDLLGCVANGPTTEAAVEAAPDAIRAYGSFLRRHGEKTYVASTFETRVVEHITEGEWLGQGSPYIVFAPDLKPLTPKESDTFAKRFGWLAEDMAEWAEMQTARQLDAKPREGGRISRAVLLHALGSPGAYLSAGLGGAPGFSRLASAAERGDLPLAQAWRDLAGMVEALVRDATPAQRAAVRVLSGGTRRYTLRKAVRRVLEHTWEHLVELSRRPSGPDLG